MCAHDVPVCVLLACSHGLLAHADIAPWVARRLARNTLHVTKFRLSFLCSSRPGGRPELGRALTQKMRIVCSLWIQTAQSLLPNRTLTRTR